MILYRYQAIRDSLRLRLKDDELHYPLYLLLCLVPRSLFFSVLFVCVSGLVSVLARACVLSHDPIRLLPCV